LDAYEQIAGAQPPRLERIEQVAQRIQRGRSWIWDAVKKGDFPQPHRLSPRCTRWLAGDVDLWIARQLNRNEQ